MTRFGVGVVALVAAASVFGGISSASAEGGCPQGQYPIGGPAGGWAGCGPIPQGGGGVAPQLPRADGKWHKTWGAVSLSATTFTAGTSTGHLKKSQAIAEAITRREESGANDCRQHATLTYYNQCAAFVGTPPGVSGMSYLGKGPTLDSAIAEGKRLCEKQGSECTVYYQDCTKPIYEKF